MSRTVIEAAWGSVSSLSMDAPDIAEDLLARFAPGLVDYLVEHPIWHWSWELHSQFSDKRVSAWGAWGRLLWALETIGDLDVRQSGYEVHIRISASGWLRAVQRGAVARPGDPVPV